MRVTGGTARGRRLIGPKNADFLRPTCDRVREALFNILGDRVKNALALELFAGTGAWGVEALSRGAKAVVFIDESPESGRLIAQNVQTCLGPGAHAGFLRLRLGESSHLAFLAEKLPPPRRLDLVFMDPPYRKNLAHALLAAVAKADILADGAVVIAEEHRSIPPPERVGGLVLQDQRQYGESGLWLFGAE